MKERISFNEFKVFFTDRLGLSPDTIDRDSNLVMDLGVDSLSLINVLFQFEEEFKIKFTGDDKVMTQTLGQAYDIYVSYLEE